LLKILKDFLIYQIEVLMPHLPLLQLQLLLDKIQNLNLILFHLEMKYDILRLHLLLIYYLNLLHLLLLLNNQILDLN